MFLLTGIALLFALAGSAAELSTNLHTQTEYNRDNKKPERVTYVDAEGNPVIADDKGYATIP